ncbi:MAG TPA: CBS domain-containing protein [Firmicutes bacterium]|nr:CBS domain-containing protein [Bacillota bacterium]
MMLVKDMMQTYPAVIGRRATIEEARRVMLDNRQSRLVVVEEGRIIGIVTDSDLFKAQHPEACVETVMSPNVVQVQDNQVIREAGRLLLENDIDGLPVVNQEGQLVGLLTSRDILRGYQRDEDRTRLTIESSAIYLAMTRSREYEHYWLEKIQGYGYRAAITQVGAAPEKLAVKLRESTIAAAIARGVVSEESREKIAVSMAVRDAYIQLSLINPGLGGGFKVSVVRGEGRVSVAIFGRFGHALADGPEQLAVGYSTI